MKKFVMLVLTLGLISILAGLIIIRYEDIKTLINTYLFINPDVKLESKNEYYRDEDFEFVQNTDNFSPKNSQDILNIYYTVLNSGEEKFYFYCPKEYESCLNDVNFLANDQAKLSDINNYVHPFNSFSHIETEYDSLGRVEVRIKHVYKSDDIKLINEEVDKIYNKVYDSKKTDVENVRAFHDYIINNSKYDSDRSDKNIVNYRSDTAYGPLFEGYAICGGYTDLMQLFLEKLNIKSFRISSEDHIWNALYINNKWNHLDLTWDDPVASDGKDYLQHEYFLINTKKLLSIEKTQHDFDQNVYSELKEA